MPSIVEKLLARGVKILAPESVYCEDIIVENIATGVVIHPGSVLKGEQTWIDCGSEIGRGGGAYLENCVLGRKVRLDQGSYESSVFLDGAEMRSGAEVRAGCILEESASCAHTVGLKQSILFPNVVLGSLINFCDVLFSGGRSRCEHSELGSCTALYNFTPSGDKFASCFGDVARGLWLCEAPIFIGGQSQIVSPVTVGFGSVIAAGAKLTQNLGDGQIYSAGAASERPSKAFDPIKLTRPDNKILESLHYIDNIRILEAWYQGLRYPLYQRLERSTRPIEAALNCLKAIVNERRKRLDSFYQKIELSYRAWLQTENHREIAAHRRALALGTALEQTEFSLDLPELQAVLESVVGAMRERRSYSEAIQGIEPALRDALRERLMQAYRRDSLLRQLGAEDQGDLGLEP